MMRGTTRRELLGAAACGAAAMVAGAAFARPAAAAGEALREAQEVAAAVAAAVLAAPAVVRLRESGAAVKEQAVDGLPLYGEQVASLDLMLPSGEERSAFLLAPGRERIDSLRRLCELSGQPGDRRERGVAARYVVGWIAGEVLSGADHFPPERALVAA